MLLVGYRLTQCTNLVYGNSILWSHLIKLIYTNDTSICQHHRTPLEKTFSFISFLINKKLSNDASRLKSSFQTKDVAWQKYHCSILFTILLMVQWVVVILATRADSTPNSTKLLHTYVATSTHVPYWRTWHRYRSYGIVKTKLPFQNRLA